MSKLKELIETLCPNGVEYKPLWSLTAWDKRFQGLDKTMQKKVVPYKYYLASEFEKVERAEGNVTYISTGINGLDRFTTEELAGDYLHDGEIVCIPWGGTPNIKYFKGKFVTGDNRIATSLDTSVIDNKFLYHDSHCEDKSILIDIQKSIDASPEMRSKKDLIETFIAGINEVEDVMAEWHDFVVAKREEELTAIIQSENLKEAETRKYIDNAFRDGELKTTGTEIDSLMPPVSRFGGGNRKQKKQSIIEKLKVFFERFFGIG